MVLERLGIVVKFSKATKSPAKALKMLERQFSS